MIRINTSYVRGQLQVDVVEEADAIRVRFTGRSLLRRPGEFVVPIVSSALEEAGAQRKLLIVDFRELDWITLSTLSPLIRVLIRGRDLNDRVVSLYRKSVAWQELFISALLLFQSGDDGGRLPKEEWLSRQ